MVAWWKRFLVAAVAAYVGGFLVESALGNWDPRRVGWSASYLPVLAEGFVFGFVLRGVWGALLAPLPLLLAPETWVRAQRMIELVGVVGLVILTQPLPVMWAGGIAGVLVRRFAPWLASRPRR